MFFRLKADKVFQKNLTILFQKNQENYINKKKINNNVFKLIFSIRCFFLLSKWNLKRQNEHKIFNKMNWVSYHRLNSHFVYLSSRFELNWIDSKSFDRFLYFEFLYRVWTFFFWRILFNSLTSKTFICVMKFFVNRFIVHFAISHSFICLDCYVHAWFVVDLL